MPCLHAAVEESNPNIALIQRMIDNGANVNEIYENQTPLRRAVGKGHVHVVQLLLERGADISLDDQFPDFPNLLCWFGWVKERDFLPNDEDKIYDMYKLLLERGVNCNQRKSVYSFTPFDYVVKQYNLKTVKLLLDHGADIRATGGEGYTAIHNAACNPHLDVIKFMCDQGFDFDCVTDENVSPLHFAARYRNFKVCEFLLRRGADVNRISTRHGRGLTPLLGALDNCDASPTDRLYRKLEKTVEVLLKFGASLIDRSEGISILELAPSHRRDEIITSFLIRNIAKMQYTTFTSEDTQQILGNNETHKIYYQMCLEELASMKETKFFDNVSVFCILMQSEKIISGYAKNEELVKAWEGCNKIEFPIYFDYSNDRFHPYVVRQRLRNPAAKVLAIMLNFNDSSHIVNQTILNYLSDEDLKPLRTGIFIAKILSTF